MVTSRPKSWHQDPSLASTPSHTPCCSSHMLEHLQRLSWHPSRRFLRWVGRPSHILHRTMCHVTGGLGGYRTTSSRNHPRGGMVSSQNARPSTLEIQVT